MVKMIVGSFDSYQLAHRAVQALIDDGFMEHDISIVASNAAGDYTPDGRVLAMQYSESAETGAVAGGLVGGAAGLTASLTGLAIPGLGMVVAVGPLIAMLSGAGAGAVAGGMIGALTHVGVPRVHAGYYAESVRRGGALVTVRADESRAERAAEILHGHGAIDIDERAVRWRDAGWQGWDAKAKPYTAEEAERDRRLYAANPDPFSGIPMTSVFNRARRSDSPVRR